MIVLPKEIYFTLKERKFFARPILSSDKDLLQNGFQKLSKKSRYLRFFAFKNELLESELEFFTNVDGINHVAWGLADITKDILNPVGVARFVKLDKESEIAEVAITIIDDYHNLGLGRVLFSILNFEAQRIGLMYLRYYVLTENNFMIDILNRFGVVNETYDGPLAIMDVRVLASQQVFQEYPEMQEILDENHPAE